MDRVLDPRTRFFDFDLLSQIDAYPIQLGGHCLDLSCLPAALLDFKRGNAAQVFVLVLS